MLNYQRVLCCIVRKPNSNLTMAHLCRGPPARFVYVLPSLKYCYRVYIYIFNNIFLYLGIYLFVYVFIYLFISQFLSFFIYIYTYIYIYCLCFKEVVHIWYIYTHVSLLNLKHTCISPPSISSSSSPRPSISPRRASSRRPVVWRSSGVWGTARASRRDSSAGCRGLDAVTVRGSQGSLLGRCCGCCGWLGMLKKCRSLIVFDGCLMLEILFWRWRFRILMVRGLGSLGASPNGAQKPSRVGVRSARRYMTRQNLEWFGSKPMKSWWVPSGYVKIAIENGHL